MPTSARRPAASQSPACANWSSPSFTPVFSCGSRRMRLGQAHRHVEVVGPGGERAREDRRHELRLDGVHHVGRAVLAGDGCHDVGIGRVDLRRGEPGGDLVAVLRPDPVDRARRPGLVVVAHDDELEEVAAGRDLGDGISDASGADEEDPHGSTLARCTGRVDGRGIRRRSGCRAARECRNVLAELVGVSRARCASCRSAFLPAFAQRAKPTGTRRLSPLSRGQPPSAAHELGVVDGPEHGSEHHRPVLEHVPSARPDHRNAERLADQRAVPVGEELDRTRNGRCGRRSRRARIRR